MKKNINGFTVVELLIVIVVIAILASISVVAYTGVQQRARDSQRKNDIQTIVKALELYYAANNRYPSGIGSTHINGEWSSTADGSWGNLISQLTPFVSTLPQDPIMTPNDVWDTGYNYSYFANQGGYCGAAPHQMYILVYRLESAPQIDNLQGNCTTNSLYYGGLSNYRVARH